MKNNLTELVFILDRSGSMSGLEADTIGGYNAMLEKQKNAEGEAHVTTILFDDRVETLHDRISIHNINPITEKEYYVRGCTALLDAIGQTISYMGNVQKYTKEEDRANKVLFVITTDGYENSSHEYSYEKIRNMIQRQKKQYDWEFLFLGANIDAVATAQRVGIREDFATNYVPDAQGTKLNYEAINEAVSCYRMNQSLNGSWKEKIERDYKKRKR